MFNRHLKQHLATLERELAAVKGGWPNLPS